MELQTLKEKIKNFPDFYASLKHGIKDYNYENLEKQYDATKHDIASRPNKWIKVNDPNAAEGVERLIDLEVVTTKLPICDQEIIVTTAAAFLCGNPVRIEANPADKTEENMLAVITKTWDDNKMDYENQAIAETMMREREVAELWYVEECDDLYWKETPNEGSEFRLRLKILSNSNGDKLYPFTNRIGDMIAFGRAFTIQDDNDKTENHFELYMADFNYAWVSKNGESWNEVIDLNEITDQF